MNAVAQTWKHTCLAWYCIVIMPMKTWLHCILKAPSMSWMELESMLMSNESMLQWYLDLADCNRLSSDSVSQDLNG